MTARVLCRAAELEIHGARTLSLGVGAARREVLLVHHEGRVIGYVNACPHLGTPLNLVDDRVFADDGRHLVCATHGALFRPEDGACIAGPCRGRRLEPLAVAVEGQDVVLAP